VASLNFTMNEVCHYRFMITKLHTDCNPQQAYASFFETVIRYLGGFLSAYALSHDPIFLSRADDLATKLLPVFGSASGLPYHSVNTVT
jgi:mannosyl-oligosaccharide alpha-1,2-mannosidase